MAEIVCINLSASAVLKGISLDLAAALELIDAQFYGGFQLGIFSGLTVVESGRVTELCVAASCEPAMQVRKSDISSVQTSVLC